jgi:hypothetical protein
MKEKIVEKKKKFDGRCPDCGKIIVPRFPLHDCVPTKNFLRAKKEKKRNLADAGGEK